MFNQIGDIIETCVCVCACEEAAEKDLMSNFYCIYLSSQPIHIILLLEGGGNIY